MYPLLRRSCNCECMDIDGNNYLCDSEWLKECISCDGECVEMPDSPVDGGVYRLRCNFIDDEEWTWEFEIVDEKL